jgi:asparagine synthase (glutamine-hydrolysing)
MLASLIFRTVLMQWQLSAAKRYMPRILKEGRNFLLVDTELENTWSSSDLTKTQINDIDHYSVPILTRYEDRNSMAHSLEIRLPFLDHRLVEFLTSLSVEYKIKNGWNKYILRKSLSDMPKQIRWRRDKKGFSLPENRWLKEDFKTDIISSFGNSILEQEGFIKGKSFIDYYNRFVNGDRKIHNFDISRVYIAEKWARNF